MRNEIIVQKLLLVWQILSDDIPALRDTLISL